MSGTLFVVATPLGNLDDLTPRAVETLRSVAAVACEDTRRTARLLSHHGIDVPTISCHRFNERSRLDPVLERLRGGESLALVSDGGTPGISDPGALLVHAALEEGLRVSPIPGPSAVATMLSASGLPGDRYVFEGFLPHRAGERRRRLRMLRDEPRTLVLFETPHRLIEALGDLQEVLGDRHVVLGRELTKLHETILSGTPRELVDRVGPEVRGEITLVVAGRAENASDTGLDTRAEEIRRVWREALRATGGDRRGALKRASRELDLNRAELYRRLAELGETDPDPTGR